MDPVGHEDEVEVGRHNVVLGQLVRSLEGQWAWDEVGERWGRGRC